MDNQTNNNATNQQPANDSQNGGEIVINLETLIKGHIKNIDAIKEEIKKQKEMLDSILENDPVYKEHSEKVKEANKLKSKTKSEIMKQPQAGDLNAKIKDGRQELKDLQLALSDYLREFQRLSGSSEIEGEDGEVREIIYTAKLIKKYQPK